MRITQTLELDQYADNLWLVYEGEAHKMPRPYPSAIWGREWILAVAPDGPTALALAREYDRASWAGRDNDVGAWAVIEE